MGHSGGGGEGERKAAGGSNLSLDNSAFFCNSSSLCSPKRLFSSWRKGAMQNKSLFESPPSLFVPNGQRLSSPSPTKDSSDAEFSSPSNPLQPAPPGHKASKSLASKTRSRRSNGRCRDRSFHSHNVGCGRCVPVCAQLQWGRSRH